MPHVASLTRQVGRAAAGLELADDDLERRSYRCATGARAQGIADGYYVRRTGCAPRWPNEDRQPRSLLSPGWIRVILPMKCADAFCRREFAGVADDEKAGARGASALGRVDGVVRASVGGDAGSGGSGGPWLL